MLCFKVLCIIAFSVLILSEIQIRLLVWFSPPYISFCISLLKHMKIFGCCDLGITFCMWASGLVYWCISLQVE